MFDQATAIAVINALIDDNYKFHDDTAECLVRCQGRVFPYTGAKVKGYVVYPDAQSAKLAAAFDFMQRRTA